MRISVKPTRKGADEMKNSICIYHEVSEEKSQCNKAEENSDNS